MDQLEATTEAKRLVGDAVALQVSDTDWEAAAVKAVTVDASGRHPHHPDWDPTFDPYWVAAEAVTTLAIRAIGAGGQLSEFESEGSRFKFTTANLWAMAAAFRNQSPLSRMGTQLATISVDGRLSGYTPTSGAAVSGLSVLSGGQIVPDDIDWS